MELEALISSKVRRRIVRVLWKLGSTNIMDLVRRVNSTYNQIIPHIVVLEREGIVNESLCGRRRMIVLQRENHKTVLLLQALKILEKDNTGRLPVHKNQTAEPDNLLQNINLSEDLQMKLKNHQTGF